MTGEQSNGKRRPVAMSMRPADIARLDEIAADAGMKRSQVACLLLEELLPSVESVRTRLQVTRKGQADGRRS